MRDWNINRNAIMSVLTL